MENNDDDDVLSVKRTRPNSTRDVSNSRRPPAAVGALSPPQEEPVDENIETSPVRLPTPLKSSLKSSGRKVLETPVRGDPENDENIFPSASELSSPRSPSKTVSQDSSNKRPFDSRHRQQTSAASEEMSRLWERMEDSDEFVCMHRCRPATPKNDKRPTAPKAMTQIDGSPERPQLSGDLDPMIAYQAGPGVKILKAPSTLRSQPKTCHAEVVNQPTLARPCDQRTPPREPKGSEPMGDEPVKKSNSRSTKGKVAPDQMDGAADFILTGSTCRGSFMDLRSEFERRDAVDSQKSSSAPVFKVRSQPHAILTKKNGQPKRPSWSSPYRTAPKSTKNGRGEVKPVASKVRGLAAMFDTAAKASTFVPTPGGVMHKKRRETARVISPYTKNPSPRASLQSTTSVSTPVSLINPSRTSIDLTNITSGSGRKSMIPRLQNLSIKDSSGATERHITPTHGRRDDSRLLLGSSNTPSRIPTPSRLPIRRKPSEIDLLTLPQLDGPHKTATKSPLKLTAQQEIRPVGYYSSPIPGTGASGGYNGLPRLSQHSTTSDFSEGIGQSGESSPFGPNPGRGRSASSLREQIRSLRAELSARNEDCAQLRLELKESRTAQQVNEILLREDLDRVRSDNAKWRRRAEVAERKVDRFERLAMKIKDARDHGCLSGEYRQGQAGDATDDYSFTNGSDHLDSAEAPPQPLTARMNQSVRRTPPASGVGANGANGGGGDGFSECSSSTVLRNVAAGLGDDSAGLWGAVDELVDFAFPGLIDKRR